MKLKNLFFLIVFLFGSSLKAQTIYSLNYSQNLNNTINKEIKQLKKYPSRTLAKNIYRNIRLKYILPVAEIFPDYVNKLRKKSDYFKRKKYFRLPKFIKRIYYYNKRDYTFHSLVGKDKDFIRTDYFFGDSLISFFNAQNNLTIVSSNDLVGIVFELRDNFYSKEKDLINWTLEKKGDKKTISAFRMYEEVKMLKFFSVFISLLFEAHYYYDYSFNYEDYCNVLQKSGLIKYLIYHGKKGKVFFNCGFNKKLAKYKKNQWEKSSEARAYFAQKIRYGKYEIFDITNPIYLSKNWIGAVRLGIKAF
jgi:hypothetical protein